MQCRSCPRVIVKEGLAKDAKSGDLARRLQKDEEHAKWMTKVEAEEDQWLMRSKSDGRVVGSRAASSNCTEIVGIWWPDWVWQQQKQTPLPESLAKTMKFEGKVQTGCWMHGPLDGMVPGARVFDNKDTKCMAEEETLDASDDRTYRASLMNDGIRKLKMTAATEDGAAPKLKTNFAAVDTDADESWMRFDTPLGGL